MVEVGKVFHSRQTARHVQRPGGLEVSLENQESRGWYWRLQKVEGQVPQSSCLLAPPLIGPSSCPTPLLLLASAPTVFALAVQRPVIHPLSSPSNRFCVTSLDPDTLPAVATLLMDVMFYSNGYGPLGRERLRGGPRGHDSAWEPQSEWGDTKAATCPGS